jgi:hypothetical protein
VKGDVDVLSHMVLLQDVNMLINKGKIYKLEMRNFFLAEIMAYGLG